jgi:putative PIN family toxin of toxin-antitoxin system
VSAARRSVVFDCNVYFQALISPGGPSAACVGSAAAGRVRLSCSERSIAELRGVASRGDLRAKFGITDDRVERLVAHVRAIAEFVDNVPERYHHPIDPDDSHYINLALATNSRLIVSRDRDLLRLMVPNDPEGRNFRALFPWLEVLNPEGLLEELARLP